MYKVIVRRLIIPGMGTFSLPAAEHELEQVSAQMYFALLTPLPPQSVAWPGLDDAWLLPPHRRDQWWSEWESGKPRINLQWCGWWGVTTLAGKLAPEGEKMSPQELTGRIE